MSIILIGRDAMTSERKLPKSFKELIKTSDRPVLVDFYADWCAPCRVLAPTVRRIAAEFSDTVLTIRINTDRRPEITEQYQITSIPTLLMFWKGEPVLRLQGALPYDKIRAQIERNLPCSCRMAQSLKTTGVRSVPTT